MNRIYFCGDTHGSKASGKFFKTGFGDLYHWNGQETDSVIIHVGDFGYGDTYNDAVKLGKRMAERGNHMYVIRGNHDNPFWFDGRVLSRGITLLPDWSLVTIHGVNILLFGGGISIDRAKRIADRKGCGEYFCGEEVRFNDAAKDIIRNSPPIDIVVNHVGPRRLTDFVAPRISEKIQSYAKEDFGLIETLETEERTLDNIMDLIFQYHRPRRWYYGHWHRNMTTNYPLPKTETLPAQICLFRGLENNEITFCDLG